MGREIQGSQTGEQKLERYGVWVKVEPRTVAESQGDQSSFELTDLEAAGPATTSRASSQEATLTVEEEQLLDELDTELGSGDKEASIPDEEPLLAEDEELPDISEAAAEAPSAESKEFLSDEELPELEIEEEPAEPAVPAGRGKAAAAEANTVEVTLSDTGDGQERFEDLDALESELASVSSSSPDPRSSSSEVLSRIEEELRSIRTDLTQLRSELSGMKKSGTDQAVAAPPSASESQSGFFDEDEDETIALTGDELDNILNTAEITEESAETASVEEPSDVTELGGDASTDGDASDLLDLESEIAQPTAAEELPAELELDDLSSLTSAPASSDGIPELDLEGIPEIETAEKTDEAGEELGELETLDLEDATEVEEVAEPSGGLELLEEISSPQDKGASENVDELANDVDLEALAAEAEQLDSDETAAPVEDLELGELEAVSDEPGSATGAPQEIEIAFENEPSAKGAMPSLAEPEELLSIEEVPAEEETKTVKPAASAGAGAIPDDLKDEIRTVLKYMDHLLEALPDEKIQEFAKSDYFVMYKKLFEDLGLGE